MTVEECHEQLLAIRRAQRTRFPLIRVDFAGATYRGRLSRTDSDPEHRESSRSPFGVLVLEGLGLARAPETILQIANIRAGGIKGIDEGQ
ncbi:MAG TPA: hypothetical protein VGY53_05520 [Isosphaeraceae bacterium]|nr:hypothetical protein [Isosphaeraceae bacterium]